jgi:hypothetical protein
MLRTTRRERDHAAEHKRAEDSEEGRKLLKACDDAVDKGPGVMRACNRRYRQWLDAQPPIMKTVDHEVGLLSAGKFLTDPRILAHTVATSAATFSWLSEEILKSRSDHWDASHPFSRTFNAIRVVIAAIDEAAARIEDARRFSSQANLRRIAQWSTLEPDSQRPRVRRSVEAQGRALICPETEARWSFPADAQLPALIKLEELRRLVS